MGVEGKEGESEEKGRCAAVCDSRTLGRRRTVDRHRPRRRDGAGNTSGTGGELVERYNPYSTEAALPPMPSVTTATKKGQLKWARGEHVAG